MLKISSKLAELLSPLKPVAKRIAKVDTPSEQYFSCFVSASLVKAFEFVDLMSNQEENSAYFFAPTLRGIAEEIIYLHFLSQFDHEVREKVLLNMMHLEVARQLHVQESFFERFRPFQTVLPPMDSDIKETKEQLKAFWQESSLTVRSNCRPSTEAIARKSGSAHLHVVYNFIYRFTSGFVHFNPQVTLRSGWGDLHRKVVFSTTHMGDYYLQTSLVYGSYLLCLHFEFFDQFFDLNQKEMDAVRNLREYLLMLPRWPEIVTFEEMNQALPQISPIARIAVQHSFNEAMRDGFISGAEKIAS